ncbi:hypothetical protein SRHO_G00244660 [Serrasalmus rhombeus]
MTMTVPKATAALSAIKGGAPPPPSPFTISSGWVSVKSPSTPHPCKYARRGQLVTWPVVGLSGHCDAEIMQSPTFITNATALPCPTGPSLSARRMPQGSFSLCCVGVKREENAAALTDRHTRVREREGLGCLRTLNDGHGESVGAVLEGWSVGESALSFPSPALSERLSIILAESLSIGFESCSAAALSQPNSPSSRSRLNEPGI